MKHRCKKCKLEGNKGICDNEKCAGYDLGSKTPTQNEWEDLLAKSLKSMGLGMSGSQAEWIFDFVREQRADARREVIDNIRGRLDLAKDEVEMAEDPKDPKVRIKYFEHVLATLREEGK